MAVTGQYLPALDGLRAFAVAGVLAYHLGFGWASGGYLGVDLFFVLSGFLITSLLLEEWVTDARIRLGAFWARRARRLLPALFLVLVAIAVYVVLNGRFGPPGSAAEVDLSGLRGDALATLFYVANWHAIFAHQSYFAQFSSPSPLEHTWSLAIEEQFYLVWPPVLVGILALAKGTWRRVGVAVTVAGTLLSAGLMALLYHPGGDPTRLYFGTDTHAFDMLAGATVAMVAAARPQPGRRARTFLHVAAPVAAVVLGIFWATAGTPAASVGNLGSLPRSYMFQGGFLLCAVLAMAVVADVRQFHQGPLGTVLSVRPLRWIGTISYGIYLWHWPIFVYLNRARTGLSTLPLDLARLGLTLAVATASYYLVERPIRQRRLKGWPRLALAPVAAGLTAVVVVMATLPVVAAPPAPVAKAGRVAAIGGGSKVAGSGGAVGSLTDLPPFGPGQPLRVGVLGDSVARGVRPGIAAALGATGELTVTTTGADGFGLNRTFGGATWKQWVAHNDGPKRPELVLATWSWDGQCTPATSLPGYRTYTCALQHHQAYVAMLETAIRYLLGPFGASGVVFMQFPLSGPDDESLTQTATSPAVRVAGERKWNQIAASMPAVFPHRVMYLPVGGSVLLDGTTYTRWLPTPLHPRAPKDTWLRVRKIDGIHLCPAGVSRYADAVLADLTSALHLRPAAPSWATQSWTETTQYFTTPSGSCPDDHPP